MRLIRIAALSVVVLVGLVSIIGKGGGSGAAAPAPIPPAGATDFNFDDPALENAGGSVMLNMTGTVNIGGATSATATISFQNLGDTVVNGQTLDNKVMTWEVIL